MSAAGAAHLKEQLVESLSLFYSFERMRTDISALIRAINKKMHHEGNYAKGNQGKARVYAVLAARGHTFLPHRARRRRAAGP
eukprot:5063116-Pleurochrysis_carterae.AAC.1